jgi:uncharacterized protein (TIGR02300 family)
MPKDEWGVKRVCPNCSSRFYDLRTDPMTCPSCGTTFALDSLTMVKPKALRPEKVKPEPEDIDDLPDIEVEAETADSDDDLDDEILEDDDDNVDLDEIADVAADDEET